MRIAMMVLAAVFLTSSLTGCGEDGGLPGKEDAQRWVDKAMNSGAELKDKLASIKDGASAESAKSALTPLITGFAKAKDFLGNVPEGITSKLGDAWEAFKNLSASLKEKAASLMENIEIKKVLGDLLSKLQ